MIISKNKSFCARKKYPRVVFSAWLICSVTLLGVPCRPRCAPSLPRPPEGKNLGEHLAEPLWACLRTCKPRERLNEIKFRIETYTAISKPVLCFPNTNNKVENFLNANSLNVFFFLSNALFITGYANKCVCVIPRSRAAALNRAPGGLSAAEARAATSNMGTRSTFGFFSCLSLI